MQVQPGPRPPRRSGHENGSPGRRFARRWGRPWTRASRRSEPGQRRGLGSFGEEEKDPALVAFGEAPNPSSAGVQSTDTQTSFGLAAIPAGVRSRWTVRVTRAEVVSISLTVSLPMEVTQMSRPSHAMPVGRPGTATASAMRRGGRIQVPDAVTSRVGEPEAVAAGRDRRDAVDLLFAGGAVSAH